MTTNTRILQTRVFTLTTGLLALALASGCSGGTAFSTNPLTPASDNAARDINGGGPGGGEHGPEIEDPEDEQENESENGDDVAPEIEVEGTLDVLADPNITVAGIAFVVGENASITVEQTGEVITLADLTVGDWLDVKGLVQDDGTNLAVRIRLDLDGEDEGTGLELESEGQIQELGVDTLMVLGQAYLVTPETVIEDKDTEEPIAFADLALGMWVDVKGIDDGETPTATRIRVDFTGEDMGAEVEREGRITELTPTSLTVMQLTFLVTDQTSIVDKDTEAPIPFSELAVHMAVDVKGFEVDGVVTATRIRVR